MRNSKVIKALMLVTQLGISMMVPIFLCVLAGGWIDKKAGTGWGMPVRASSCTARRRASFQLIP